MKSRIVQGLAVAGCYGCIIAVIIEYGKKAGTLCALALLFHSVVMAAIEAREEKKKEQEKNEHKGCIYDGRTEPGPGTDGI